MSPTPSAKHASVAPHTSQQETEQIALLRSSVFETVFQNGWRRSGLFELVNRVLVTLPMTIVPVLFERIDNGEYKKELALHDQSECGSFRGSEIWKLVFQPIFDRRLSKTFERALFGTLVRLKRVPAKPALLKEEWHACLVPLFDTSYAVMFWHIDMASEHGIALTCRPLNPNNKNHARDRAVWKRINKLFSTSQKENPSWDLIADALDTNVGVIRENSTRHLRPDMLLQHEDDRRRASDCTILHEAVNRLRSLWEDIYPRYAGSPLLLHGPNTPDHPASLLPNCLLFWKVFDRADLRCKAYTYDCRLILAPTQRQHIAGALVAKRELVEELAPPNDGPDGPRFLAHRRLIELLRQSNSNSPKDLTEDPAIKEILSALEARQPHRERLFCEHTISSGLASMRFRPLEPGRQSSIDETIKNESEGKEPDLHFRATCFRALFRLMLPEKCSLTQSSILMLPVRVGGAPAGCIVAMRPHVNTELGLLDQRTFFYSFQYYHAIIGHMVRRLRNKSQVAYLESAALWFRKHLHHAMSDWAKHRKSFEPESLSHALTCDLGLLARVFPWEAIKIEPAKLDDALSGNADIVPFGRGTMEQERSLNIARLHEAWHRDFRVELLPNPVFDRIGVEPFLDVEEVSRIFGSAAFTYEGSPEYARLAQRIQGRIGS